MGNTDSKDTNLLEDTKPSLKFKAVFAAIAAPCGALFDDVNGLIGKYSLSFFNPNLASVAGTFKTFALMGAISVYILPRLILDTFISDNHFLKNTQTYRKF